MPRNPAAPSQADADAYANLLPEPAVDLAAELAAQAEIEGLEMPAERPLREEDLFADDDEPEAPAQSPATVVASEEEAPVRPASRAPSKESSSSSSSSSTAPVPAAGSADVNPLEGPDPTVPVVDDIEELRQRLALMTPPEIFQIQNQLRNAEVDADGNIEFEGKKISTALRKQYMKMMQDEQRSRVAGKKGLVIRQ